MINSWKGKEKLPKGSLTYMDKISKGVAPNVYYRWLFNTDFNY